MEKIERLAKLNPRTQDVAGHALEMWRLLRAFAILDWTLSHNNDMSEKQQMEKYAKLMDKCWKLMNDTQAEIEDEAEANERLVELAE